MSPYLSHALHQGSNETLSSIEQAFPHLEHDPVVLPKSLDPFTITTSTGFMPLSAPQVELPAIFKPLVDLASALPCVKADGSPGLLASYELGPAVDNKATLPDLTDAIDTLVASDGKSDFASITAAFRDYAFIASAYLLEPCWQRYNSGLEGYGLGREILPKSIAGPLVKTARMSDASSLV